VDQCVAACGLLSKVRAATRSTAASLKRRGVPDGVHCGVSWRGQPFANADRFLSLSRLDDDEPRPARPRRLSDAAWNACWPAPWKANPQGCHALVHALPRPGHRAQPEQHQALERPFRCNLIVARLQAEPRPACSLTKSATFVGLYLHPPDRALCCAGREAANSGAGPHRPLLPYAPRTNRAPHPRLQTPRHHQPVSPLRLASGHVLGQLHRRHRSRDE